MYITVSSFKSPIGITKIDAQNTYNEIEAEQKLLSYNVDFHLPIITVSLIYLKFSATRE
jgi:hypothetical protein